MTLAQIPSPSIRPRILDLPSCIPKKWDARLRSMPMASCGNHLNLAGGSGRERCVE